MNEFEEKERAAQLAKVKAEAAKLDAEARKLGAEATHLGLAWWKRAAYVGSVATLAVSLLGALTVTIGGFFDDRIEEAEKALGNLKAGARQAKADLEMAEARLALQNIERSALEQDRRRFLADIDRLRQQEETLRRDHADIVERVKNAEAYRNAIGALTEAKVIVLIESDGSEVHHRIGLEGLPSELLGHVSKLGQSYLKINGTQVSDLSPLKGLTNLRGLELGETQVSDLSPLEGLTNLQYLGLSDTHVGDLSPLTGLTNLQQLQLRDSQVSDPAPLKDLTNLELLVLSGTQVSDLSPLGMTQK